MTKLPEATSKIPHGGFWLTSRSGRDPADVIEVGRQERMISLYRDVPTRITTKPSTCPMHHLSDVPIPRLPVHALL